MTRALQTIVKRHTGRLLAAVMIVCLAEQSLAAPEFEETFGLLGITHRHLEGTGTLGGIDDTLGSGVCAADLNGDGWVDLFFVGGSGTSRRYGRTAWWTSHTGHRVYMNESGRFSDATERVLGDFNTRVRGMGCAIADLDGNGWADIVVTSRGEDQVLLNDGGRISRTAILPESGGWSTSVAFFDPDADGDLDLLIGRYIHYQRDQNVLEFESGFKPSVPPPFDPELYNPARSATYRNLGDGNFEAADLLDADALTGRTLSVKNSSEGILVLNQSGQPSQLLSENSANLTIGAANDAQFIEVDDAARLLLVRNSGSGFQLRSTGTNVVSGLDEAWDRGLNTNSVLGRQLWAAVATDFDNDGDTDVFASAGSAMLSLDSKQMTLPQSNLLLEQDNGSFSRIELVSAARSSRGAVFADLNNDGLRDLVVVNNNDVPTVLLNRSNAAGSFVGLDLGAHGNSLAGSEVCIVELQACESVDLPENFLSQSDSRLVFRVPHTASLPLTLRATLNGRRVEWQVPGLGGYFRITAALDLEAVTPGDERFALLASADGSALVQLFYAPEPALLGDRELLARIREDNKAAQRFADAFAATPKPEALGLALRLLTDDPDAARATALIRGIASVESDVSTAVLTPLLYSAGTETVCAITDLLVHWYDEEEAAVLTKDTAISALLYAAETAATDARTICLLQAVGASESFRAIHTLRALLNRSDAPGVVAAIVRAIGHVRHTSLVADLRTLAAANADPEVAAEIAVAAKRLNPALSLDDILSWNSAELSQAGVLVALLQHEDSVVHNRTLVINAAQRASRDASANPFERAEIALLTNAPVDLAALPEPTTPAESALALASGQPLQRGSLNIDVVAALAANHADQLARLDQSVLDALAAQPELLGGLAAALSPAQKQRLVGLWLGTSSVSYCTTYDIHGDVDYDTATPRDLACMDARAVDSRQHLAFYERFDETFRTDRSASRELLRTAYGHSEIAGRATAVRLLRSLDPSEAAELAARLAAEDASFVLHDFGRYWPLLDDSEKLQVLSGASTTAFATILEDIVEDQNESMSIRLQALSNVAALTGTPPSSLMEELLTP